MLVLSRKRGESIILELEDGRRITIEVVDIRAGGIARLGVTADQSISINRDEIQAEIDADRARGGRP